MKIDYEALLANWTWELVDLPTHLHVPTRNWVFEKKNPISTDKSKDPRPNELKENLSNAKELTILRLLLHFSKPLLIKYYPPSRLQKTTFASTRCRDCFSQLLSRHLGEYYAT